MHRYYCSYFDRNYLVKALALIASLNRHSTAPFTLYAVCLDEITRIILDRLAPPNVVSVPLHLVEEHDTELLAAKKNRSCVEYYWTLTPSILLWLFDRHPEIELLTYLDADLYFYGDVEPVFEEMGGSSILIHGHRFPDEMKHLERYGKYNVGLTSFRRDDSALEALQWWRERCNEWCYKTIDSERYGDQRYLDDWPERFRKVHVLENVGAGVAPWNHGQYSYGLDPFGGVLVEGRQLIFYHFHSLFFASEGLVVPTSIPDYVLPEAVIRLCMAPYMDTLATCARAIREILPRFRFGLGEKGVLTPEATFLARKDLAPQIRKFGIDHPSFDLGNGWECYVTRQMSPASPDPPAHAQQSLAK